MPKKKITPLNEDFDFKLFVTIARKNAVWFFVFLTLSILIAMLILRYTPPVYEATNVIKLSSENKANIILGARSNFQETNQNLIAGDIELIRSNVIIERALNKLPLDLRYFVKGTVLEYELYKQAPFQVEIVIKDSIVYGKKFFVDFPDPQHVSVTYTDINNIKKSERFRINEWMRLGMADIKISIRDFVSINALQNEMKHNIYYFMLSTHDELTSEIYSGLSVLPLNLEANTIAIKFRDKNSLKAADIVNAIAAEFNQYDLEKNSEVANKILDFIDNTIIQINMELSNSENQIEQFKRNNQIIDPASAATDVYSQMREVQTQSYVLDFEYNLLEKLRKEIIHDNDIANFILSISGNSDNLVIQQQLGKLQQLMDERDQLLLQATPESEVYKSITVKINTQKELLLRTLDNEQDQLTTKKQALLKRLSEYENKTPSAR